MSIKEQHLQEQLESLQQESADQLDENIRLSFEIHDLKSEMLDLYRRLDVIFTERKISPSVMDSRLRGNDDGEESS